MARLVAQIFQQSRVWSCALTALWQRAAAWEALRSGACPRCSRCFLRSLRRWACWVLHGLHGGCMELADMSHQLHEGRERLSGSEVTWPSGCVEPRIA